MYPWLDGKLKCLLSLNLKQVISFLSWPWYNWIDELWSELINQMPFSKTWILNKQCQEKRNGDSSLPGAGFWPDCSDSETLPGFLFSNLSNPPWFLSFYKPTSPSILLILLGPVSFHNFLNVFLTVSGLSWGMQDLSLRHSGSLAMVRWLSCPTASGILFPQPGIEPASPALEGALPSTGPPGKSLHFFIFELERVGFYPFFIYKLLHGSLALLCVTNEPKTS